MIQFKPKLYWTYLQLLLRFDNQSFNSSARVKIHNHLARDIAVSLDIHCKSIPSCINMQTRGNRRACRYHDDWNVWNSTRVLGVFISRFKNVVVRWYTWISFLESKFIAWILFLNLTPKFLIRWGFVFLCNIFLFSFYCYHS